MLLIYSCIFILVHDRIVFIILLRSLLHAYLNTSITENVRGLIRFSWILSNIDEVFIKVKDTELQDNELCPICHDLL
jgi:hypothetical protein